MEKPRDSGKGLKYLEYLGLGIEFLCAVGLPTAVGIWLDRRWGTLVLFTLLGLALGFATGFWMLYGRLYNHKSRRPGNGPSGKPGG